MRVALITGSAPPMACGVGDYTARLSAALTDQGVKVEVLSANLDWRLSQARNTAAKIADTGADIYHIQYPTTGYGARLGPQALSLLLSPCVVTVHEVSQVHMLRRVSLYPFSIGADRLVFTSEYEKSYALRWAPWAKNRASVIPIGSFISTRPTGIRKSLEDIVYFGLVRPNKGIEQVIELARKIKAANLPYRVRIIGTADPKQRAYLNGLRAMSEGLPMDWDLGLPEPQVAELLVRARIAYVPFPDGASERRSSLLALLSSGVATITTRGPFTTEKMASALAFAGTPAEALDHIHGLIVRPGLREELSERAFGYAKAHDWGGIASRHCGLYGEVLTTTEKGRKS